MCYITIIALLYSTLLCEKLAWAHEGVKLIRPLSLQNGDNKASLQHSLIVEKENYTTAPLELLRAGQ